MGKIAFIGLGAMGGPMASNIARKKIALTVYDISDERIRTVVEAGATRALSLADAVMGADIVVTMLPATQHVLEVVTGPGGVLEHLTAGGLLIDMSTIATHGTDRLIQACTEKGVGFIDAPVGRLVMHAVQGKSMFMVGCDNEADFQRAKPLFDAMGVDSSRVYSVTSAIGGGLAGLAAALMTLQFDIYPHIGMQFGPLVFMVCVLGGLGNLIGGFVAALIISQFIAVGGSCFASEWGYAIAFLFFIVMMFIRPAGLLGSR